MSLADDNGTALNARSPSPAPSPASTPAPSRLLHINEAWLPLGISLRQAKEYQQSVREVGQAWFARRSVKVEFVVIPRDCVECTDGNERRLLCNSTSECNEFFDTLDLTQNRVLIQEGSKPSDRHDRSADLSTEKTQFTVPLLVRLCKMCDISPTIIPMLQGDNGIWTQLRLNESSSDIGNEAALPYDFAYAYHAPWLSQTDQDSVDHTTSQLSLVGYTKVDSSHTPFVSVFFGVGESSAVDIKAIWRRNIQASYRSSRCFLLDHFALLAFVLSELQNNMKMHDMWFALVGVLRLESHITSRASIERTISKGAAFLAQLHRLRASMGDIERLAKHWTKPLRPTALKCPLTNVEDQHDLWCENLRSTAITLAARVDHLIIKMQAAHTMAISVVALKNGAALNRNTEELTIMARATEISGQETQLMSKRMEEDARLMKFLSEVTAFFLPITAIATTFSMGFFSMSPGRYFALPSMPNLKYIWLYLVVAVPISAAVFGWWAWKRFQIKHSKTNTAPSNGAPQTTDDESNIDAIGTGVKLEQRLAVREARRAAQEELDRVRQVGVPEDDEDAKHAHDNDIMGAFENVLFLQCLEESLNTTR